MTIEWRIFGESLPFSGSIAVSISCFTGQTISVHCTLDFPRFALIRARFVSTAVIFCPGGPTEFDCGCPWSVWGLGGRLVFFFGADGWSSSSDSELPRSSSEDQRNGSGTDMMKPRVFCRRRYGPGKQLSPDMCHCPSVDSHCPCFGLPKMKLIIKSVTTVTASHVSNHTWLWTLLCDPRPGSF
jgi:hypothetical protein